MSDADRKEKTNESQINHESNEDAVEEKARVLRDSTVKKTNVSRSNPSNPITIENKKRKQSVSEKKSKKNPSKKLKLETTVDEPKENVDIISSDVEDSKKEVESVDTNKKDKTKKTTKSKPQITRCAECFQIINDKIVIFPEACNETDETEVLFHPTLIVEGGGEMDYKITNFTIFDKNTHVCPLDTGSIEKEKDIFIGGVVKKVDDDDPSSKSGVAAKCVGPIREWFVAGYDGGNDVLVGITTEIATYYFMTASEIYKPFMKSIREKTYLTKLVIEFLNSDETGTYEDLINKIQATPPPDGYDSFTEENLLHHAQFIVDQVDSYDRAADADENLLTGTQCMRALINLAGVSREEKKTIRARVRDVQKKPKDTKATTTPLVRQLFEIIFKDQIETTSKSSVRRKRCGICEACRRSDCGKCVHCKNMRKFGGPGTVKQVCVQRKCKNLGYVEEIVDDLSDDEEEKNEELNDDESVTRFTVPKRKPRISWVGEAIGEAYKKTFYKSADINSEIYQIGDYVLVYPTSSEQPLLTAKIIYMFQDKTTGKMNFHAHWFWRGSNTILSETSIDDEVFITNNCCHAPLATIMSKCEIIYEPPPSNWAFLGGKDVDDLKENHDQKKFYYKLLYQNLNARFEDPPTEYINANIYNNKKCDFCPCCERLDKLRESELVCFGNISHETTHNIFYESVRWNTVEYRIGSQIFLKPDAFKFKLKLPSLPDKEIIENVDEERFPEYYRKSKERDNVDIQTPFKIGHIESIYSANKRDNPPNASDVKIAVKKFYRPENTHRGMAASYSTDFNLLYWSNEQSVVNLTQVQGVCYVSYCCESFQSETLWDTPGHHFYFNEAYNAESKTFEEPPYKSQRLGNVGKGKGKGKGKKNEDIQEAPIKEQKLNFKRLKAMDIFAGCGGLSEGFHQAGICDTLWAIEFDEMAAQAFRLNNPKCTVFNSDCNDLLRMAIEGQTTNKIGQTLPRKGDIDLLCGGPPCQGFSGMNRFTAGQCSQFKNSLVVSYLSYCDFYRPKFFFLENVRNFVSYKQSMILKLTLSCLVRMGYQCTFGVLQAGNYGVPQSRRRAFILAAAPNEKLPLFPEPKHVFKNSSCQVTVDNRKYLTNVNWLESAPYRHVTVRDSLSDLPPIQNGAKNEEITYTPENQSHFQKILRKNNPTRVIHDHVCKEMRPLVAARIHHIPCQPFADWRDLPNIEMTLSDGGRTKKLEYEFEDGKNGRSSTGALRGVCRCAESKVFKKCDPQYRQPQDNTIIPWCLPHTGNRHNNWAGLYGRLDLDSHFKTTVTNPEPMGKQGKVLHPDQHRVLSVRECARSQGFPDSYKFFGNILDRHKQVGNAVPPPLAREIGLEIKKCLEPLTEESNSDNKKDEVLTKPGSSKL